MTCILCAWPEDDLVATSARAKAFFVRNPARPGHIAVAVRAHHPTLIDTPPEDAAAVLELAQRVAAAAAPVLGVEKFYLAAVGDVDPHFHIHLLPKRPEDPKLGPYLFSAQGWQGHGGRDRDAATEAAIRAAVGTIR